MTELISWLNSRLNEVHIDVLVLSEFFILFFNSLFFFSRVETFLSYFSFTSLPSLDFFALSSAILT